MTHESQENECRAQAVCAVIVRLTEGGRSRIMQAKMKNERVVPVTLLLHVSAE